MIEEGDTTSNLKDLQSCEESIKQETKLIEYYKNVPYDDIKQMEEMCRFLVQKNTELANIRGSKV